jgi:hypothetical protein
MKKNVVWMKKSKITQRRYMLLGAKTNLVVSKGKKARKKLSKNK